MNFFISNYILINEIIKNVFWLDEALFVEEPQYSNVHVNVQGRKDVLKLLGVTSVLLGWSYLEKRIYLQGTYWIPKNELIVFHTKYLFSSKFPFFLIIKDLRGNIFN